MNELAQFIWATTRVVSLVSRLRNDLDASGPCPEGETRVFLLERNVSQSGNLQPVENMAGDGTGVFPQPRGFTASSGSPSAAFRLSHRLLETPLSTLHSPTLSAPSAPLLSLCVLCAVRCALPGSVLL